jgi:lipopolysaccharide transport system permease protein
MAAASITTAGRSALQRRDLFTVLVRRQFWLRRKRSWLGQVWPVLSPFLLMALYIFVFKRVFRVPVERYPDYLLCGLLPWAFLTTTVTRSASSISTEVDMLRKAPFPPELLPLSNVVASLIDFGLTLAIFVVALGVRGELPFATLPVLVVPLVAVSLLAMALSMLVALVDVYSHDLRRVLGNALTVWFFLVPIVYRPHMAPSSISFLRSIDPMNLVVTQMRDVLYRGRLLHMVELGLMVALSAALFAGSLVVFRRLSTDLAKDV